MSADQGTQRGIVAEFHKSAGGRLTLFNFYLIDENGRLKTYDIEWSRTYGYIYDQSGFGGCAPLEVSGPYFVSGDVSVKEMPTKLVDGRDKPPWRSKRTRAIRERNRTRRLRALPKAFAVEPGRDLLDWLHQNAIQQGSVWCSTCRDWLPDDSPCEHIWWCDTKCWWSTPSERCKHGTYERCTESASTHDVSGLTK